MSHSITLDEAIERTRRYRLQRDTILDSSYQGKDILPLSETFEKKAIIDLLSHPGCHALRIYYGMDEDLNMQCILVGSNENNQDILPVGDNDDHAELLDRGVRCPPQCPEPGPLN